jgi:DNA-binding response OmpR family regulator
VCILVVEDEFLIRFLLTEILVGAGFGVCEAPNGDQAAPLIEAPPEPFSLLITDIHMPGQMDGFAVANLMRTRHPGVPIIYTTGRPDVFDSMGPLREQEVLLPKPYSPSALLNLAKQMLATDCGNPNR